MEKRLEYTTVCILFLCAVSFTSVPLTDLGNFCFQTLCNFHSRVVSGNAYGGQRERILPKVLLVVFQERNLDTNYCYILDASTLNYLCFTIFWPLSVCRSTMISCGRTSRRSSRYQWHVPMVHKPSSTSTSGLLSLMFSLSLVFIKTVKW